MLNLNVVDRAGAAIECEAGQSTYRERLAVAADIAPAIETRPAAITTLSPTTLRGVGIEAWPQAAGTANAGRTVKGDWRFAAERLALWRVQPLPGNPRQLVALR
jgi:hypothetical protein